MTVAIIGAGMAGSALAMALERQRPSLDLIVVDAGPGDGASGIPAALCHPLTAWSMQDWKARTATTEASRAWIDSVLGEGGAGWIERPLVRPLLDDKRGQRLLRSFHRTVAPDVEHVSPEAVAVRFPGLGHAPLGALVYRDAASVNVAELCAQIRRRLTARGVTFVDGDVESVDGHGLRLQGGDVIEASSVAVCGGARASHLIPGLGSPRRYYGELLFVDAPAPEFVVAGGCHIAPTPDGRTVIGSTWHDLEDLPADDGVSHWALPSESALIEAREALVQRAAAWMPSLRGARVVSRWGGVRAKFEAGVGSKHPWRSGDGRLVALAGFGSTGLSHVWTQAQRTAAEMIS